MLTLKLREGKQLALMTQPVSGEVPSESRQLAAVTLDHVLWELRASLFASISPLKEGPEICLQGLKLWGVSSGTRNQN